MHRFLKTGLAAGMLLDAIGAAQAFTPAFDPDADDFQVGGNGPAQVTKAQLGIISPADGVCPGNAKITGWIFSTEAATFNVMLVNKNGGVFGPYPVKTRKSAGGYMGTLNTGLAIDAPTDTKYRIVIANSDVVSNWVPLTACI
jgi:hypothetical protein